MRRARAAAQAAENTSGSKIRASSKSHRGARLKESLTTCAFRAAVLGKRRSRNLAREIVVTCAYVGTGARARGAIWRQLTNSTQLRAFIDEITALPVSREIPILRSKFPDDSMIVEVRRRAGHLDLPRSR